MKLLKCDLFKNGTKNIMLLLFSFCPKRHKRFSTFYLVTLKATPSTCILYAKEESIWCHCITTIFSVSIKQVVSVSQNECILALWNTLNAQF